jgi:hypothetical protein
LNIHHTPIFHVRNGGFKAQMRFNSAMLASASAARAVAAARAADSFSCRFRKQFGQYLLGLSIVFTPFAEDIVICFKPR